jgi:hypothetical protein
MITSLETHPVPYVRIAELAAYWGVAPKVLYKLMANGCLYAVRFGARSTRVSIAEALRCEHEARFQPAKPLSPSRARDNGYAASAISAGSRAMASTWSTDRTM